MDIKIGSNAYRNTNGILIIQGKEQVVLELQLEQHQLLLTIDLYDAEGTHAAHLRRNEWAFNLDQRFAFASGPETASLFSGLPWLTVSLVQTGETVFEARLAEADVVDIPNGRFYTHKGQLVEISSHFCRIEGGTARFGDVADLRGGRVTLD